MTTISPLPTQEEVHDTASLWIARMDRGLSAAEESELKTWLSESEIHRDILFSMTQQWDKIDALSCLSEVFPHTSQAKTEAWKSSSLAIAASIVFVVLVSAVGFMSLDSITATGPSDFSLVNYETAVGEQSSVVLPDGTTILLNTNTLVSVAYTEDERLFRLQRGELNVDVAHNPLRPLRVVTNNHVVEAVGTAFNMKLTGSYGVELLVTDGTVLVAQIANEPGANELLKHVPEPLITDAASIAVSAGEEILLGSEDELLKPVNPEDISVRLSWKEGDLIFQGESLQIAMAEVGRYTSTEFVFLDDTAKSVRIAGRFKAGDLDALLMALSDSFNIDCHRVNESKVELASKY